MRRGQHRNWLVTIAEIHLPFVLWGAFVLALALAVLSSFVKPVYRASSVLSLDSDLNKVLKNVDTAFPDMTLNDYIRSEYFAIHNQTLMRLPKIAEQFVERYDIRGKRGKRLLPERLVEPGLLDLLFNNDGRGIRVSWVSDTQQFSISGFSRDPAQAADFANGYVQLLLKENGDQFQGTFSSLVARFTNEIAEMTRQFNELGEQTSRLRLEHRSYDPVTEVDKISDKILSVKDSLNTALLGENTYQVQLAALTRKAEDYARYSRYQHVMEANPQLAKLKTNIEELAVELASTSVTYTPEHPAYQALEKKLETAKSMYAKEAEKSLYQEIEQVPGILDTVRESLLTAELNHVVYQAKVGHYQALLVEYQARTAELIDLASQLDLLEKKRSPIVTSLTKGSTNLAEVQSLAKTNLPFYRVVSVARVDPGEVAYYQYFPKSSLVVIVFLASFLALAFLVVARELHAETLYHGWQLAGTDDGLRWADVPTLAAATMRRAGWEVEVAGHARDVFAAVRAERLVRICGAHAGCGKATVAAALGAYLVNLGESVVIVDADTSRRGLSGMKGLASLPGLAEVLAGSLAVAAVVRPGDGGSPAVVPAGQGGAAGRVDAGTFGRMLAELEASFARVIVVDAPACDDRTMLAELLPPHRTLLVVRSGWQSVSEVSDAARPPAGERAVPAGVIVNRTPFEADVLSFPGLCRLAWHLVAGPFQHRQ